MKNISLQQARKQHTRKMSFSNKVVIVTGASSGIGAAAAISFSKEGASVVIVARNEAKLQKIAETLKTGSGDFLLVTADVSKEEDAKRIIENTVKKFGKIDVLVNNAGIARKGSLLDGTLMQTYDEVMNINLRAVFHLTMLATPHLVKTKGNVVNISSVAGSGSPFPSWATYCTSKAALNHFTKGAAFELASAGVRVNAISPGPVRTEIIQNAGITDSFEDWGKNTALQRVSQAEEIADLILYLASDKAKGMTGSIVLTDNGMLLR